MRVRSFMALGLGIAFALLFTAANTSPPQNDQLGLSTVGHQNTPTNIAQVIQAQEETLPFVRTQFVLHQNVVGVTLPAVQNTSPDQRILRSRRISSIGLDNMTAVKATRHNPASDGAHRARSGPNYLAPRLLSV